jgi:hypothetical protein
MWVYLKSREDGQNIFTVGFFYNRYYAGEEKVLPVFEPAEDFNTEAEARKLVHYLNGGKDHERQAS